MARHPISTSYITPFKADGTEQVVSAVEFGRGAFTLLANTTYYYPLGGQDCPHISSHFQWDDDIIITSITVEDCNFPESEAAQYASDAGLWIPETPTDAEVEFVGAGVTCVDGVIAVAGGAQGGCMFHVSATGGRRTRMAVVVGGTGGEVRNASWGKE